MRKPLAAARVPWGRIRQNLLAIWFRRHIGEEVFRGVKLDGEHFLRKLQAFGRLSADSEAALRALSGQRHGMAPAGEDIISEGDDPREIFLILEGWAYRYKLLEDGRRQIIALFVPGDLCDLNVYILKEMDHSIAALTTVRFARISERQLEDTIDNHPRAMRALWWESLVGAAIQREWTVTIGQRDAYESLAHLLCELYLRLRLVGLVSNRSCPLPLTQRDLADALGLTPTHLGRVLRKLNESGLAQVTRRKLVVHDLGALQRIAMFNPNYLHHQDG
jgi:CRP-like cAMP-binding protein